MSVYIRASVESCLIKSISVDLGVIDKDKCFREASSQSNWKCGVQKQWVDNKLSVHCNLHKYSVIDMYPVCV